MRLSVLVVDDDRLGSILAESVLALLGVEVVLARDGLECIAAFRTRHFDIIFMDHLMPSMSGLDATVEIRRIEKSLALTSTPIVALTASALPSQVEAFRKAGASDVLLKPYRIEHLAEMLERWAPRR